MRSALALLALALTAVALVASPAAYANLASQARRADKGFEDLGNSAKREVIHCVQTGPRSATCHGKVLAIWIEGQAVPSWGWWIDYAVVRDRRLLMMRHSAGFAA